MEDGSSVGGTLAVSRRPRMISLRFPSTDHLHKGPTMQRLATIAILLAALTAGAGCSEQTVQETKEAGQAVGEAAKSATEDAAENTKKAAEKVEDSLDDDDRD